MADKCQWALKRNDYKLHTFPFSFLLHIDLKRGLLVMMYVCSYITLVAGAWTEREKMYHGGSFLKLAHGNVQIKNPRAQNQEVRGF